VLQGQQARLTFNARYFFGQPVANGRVRYVVHRASYYSPWRWVDQPQGEEDQAPAFYGGDEIAQAQTTLDAAGSSTVLIPVPQDDEHRDFTLRVEARVSDSSGRQVTGHATFVAPWARFLLAIAADQYVYRPGSLAAVRVRAVDYEGSPQRDIPIRFALERLTYTGDRYDSPRVERLTTGAATTDAEGATGWTVPVPSDHGDYRIRAETSVDGRAVTADASFFLPEGDTQFYDEGDRTLELIADRATYAPGSTAILVLRGEPITVPVLVTKEHDRTTWHRVVRPGQGGVIEVPVDDQDVGDVWVNVAFVRDDRVYRAERRLRVPPVARTLNIALEPASVVARPRDPGIFKVRVTDAMGQPVRAQLSLGVVDEAIYAIKPDLTPDPVRFFHRRSYSRVGTQFSRDYGFVGYSGQEPLQLARRRRPFSLADFKADRPERAEVRREFPDAIFWLADLVTGADGTGSITVAYPDALTTWRLTARAVTEDTKVGSALTRTTVTKDVILRLAAPRFLTEGDTLRLPVIAHNYHEGPRALDVSVTARGLSAVSAPPAPLRLEVPSAGSRSAPFVFRAEKAGTATIAGSALSRGAGDRLEVAVPILPFGLKREAGSSGSSNVSGDVRVRLEVPPNTNPAERIIEVAVAPTLAGSLLNALDFLIGYPYGCTEQLLSSFLPNLLVLRALDQLTLAPTERMRDLDRVTAQGVRRLLENQHEDGGWGWWAADQNHPFMTAYALYGLLEADRAGVSIERTKIEQAATAAARLYAEYPRAVPELKAYIAWVLALAAARDVRPSLDESLWSPSRALDELWDARSRMTPQGLALLLLTLDTAADGRGAEVSRQLLDAAQTRGDLTWWPGDRDPLLGDELDTTVETTALAVQALAGTQPDHPTLERAVRWLLANRTGGSSWGTTKQTALALYGLLALLDARDEAPTTFALDVSINGQPAGSHTFTPAAWTSATSVVIRGAAQTGTNEIVLTKRGPGWLYWTATARYYETQEPIERSGSKALALRREYFALTPITTNGRNVYRPGSLPASVQPGDVILVRVTAAGAADWRYLVLDDPIPAGMEAILEPEVYELERPTSWWTGSRREYRDASVVQFQETFEQGRYEYNYLLKAVTPGEFRAMPAQIAPMYVPGVSASTTTQNVSIAAPPVVASSTPR
jgi:uncharacterized protein YfaS (alpha-2-macroglobulin family)